MFAFLAIREHRLNLAVAPVAANVPFDGAVGLQVTPYQRRVATLHRALKKLHAQRRHRLLRLAQDHYARGVLIEPVHQSWSRDGRFVGRKIR